MVAKFLTAQNSGIEGLSLEALAGQMYSYLHNVFFTTLIEQRGPLMISGGRNMHLTLKSLKG